jgi:DNA-binding MarR family transcriptional regulator
VEAAVAGSARGIDEDDPLEAIEIASAVLMRNFELLRRRSDIYSELDRSEYLLLRALQQTGPADIGMLAAALGLDPSTAGRQVAAMQRKGLVSCAPSVGDRRRSIATATPEGRRLREATRRRRREATAELLHGWSQADLQQLARMFTRYNQAIARAYLHAPPQQPPQPLAALDLTTTGGTP